MHTNPLYVNIRKQYLFPIDSLSNEALLHAQSLAELLSSSSYVCRFSAVQAVPGRRKQTTSFTVRQPSRGTWLCCVPGCRRSCKFLSLVFCSLQGQQSQPLQGSSSKKTPSKASLSRRRVLGGGSSRQRSKYAPVLLHACVVCASMCQQC